MYEVIGYEHRKGTSKKFGDYDKVIYHCKTEEIDPDYGFGSRVEKIIIDLIRNPQKLPVPDLGAFINVHYNRLGYPVMVEIV